jgi:DMSO/TMAO reductase YedYZ molybdopterin-dependent catalytic subunit
MTDRFVTRGFVGRRDDGGPGDAGDGDDRRRRTPPGQYLTSDFPVLSAGPTPRTALDRWTLEVEGLVASPVRWTWEEFLALPSRDWVVDISCVTKWTHLDMRWKGVSVDTLLEGVELDPKAAFVIAYCDGGYTTNLPLADVLNNQAFVAYEYDDRPLAPEHGGPARLVVPARYFWKSAKWIRGLRIQAGDEPGFWESLGYHNRGDQWREERYSGD